MSLSLLNIDDFIVFGDQTPYTNVQQFTSYQEAIDASGEYEVSREFAWSYDQKYWSNYEELSGVNLLDVPVDPPGKSVWIKFRYRLLSGSSIVINSVILEYDPFTPEEVPPQPNPDFTVYNNGNWRGTMFLNQYTFDPYNVTPGVSMLLNLNKVVNNMFGHETEYFRALPDGTYGKDIVFKEYKLQTVEDAKCVKVLVPNNDFPENSFVYSAMGIDFNGLPFEVNIDKAYFESIYGKGAAPQRNDIIHFPLMNKVFEVRESFLHRDFMQIPLYYKVSLVKWQPKANVIKSDEITEHLNEITKNTDQFAEEQVKEEKRVTNPDQFEPKFTESDLLRRDLDINLNIIENDIYNYYTLLSQFQYDLASTLPEGGVEPSRFVEYSVNLDWPNQSERTFTAWFKDNTPTKKSRNVSGISRLGNEITVHITGTLTGVSVGDWISITRSTSDFGFYGQVTQHNSTTIKINVDQWVLDYIDTTDPGWQSYNALSCRIIWESIFMKVGDFKISSWMNRFFLVKWGNIEYRYYALLNSDDWYSMVITRSNVFKQMQFSILRLPTQSGLTNSALEEVIYELENIDIDYEDLVLDEGYGLYQSPMLITNIRLLDSILNKEEFSRFLNQNIVIDANTGIIIDNATPRYRPPYASVTW